MHHKLRHSVYQKTLTDHLAKWQRRRSRPLDPEWLDAALLLVRLDLDSIQPSWNVSTRRRLVAARPMIQPVCCALCC